jgi:hypothetical protein
MTTLTLLMPPLASFCHKVLIALHENGDAVRGADGGLRRGLRAHRCAQLAQRGQNIDSSTKSVGDQLNLNTA